MAPCAPPRPSANHGPSIRSRVWRKSSRASRRRPPSRPGSSRASPRVARRGCRCPRRPATPRCPAALRPAIKICPRWRNGWRPRCVARPSPWTRSEKPASRPRNPLLATPGRPRRALEDFAPPPASRLGAALRRPFRTDDTRASPFAPKTAGEPTGAGMEEFAPAPPRRASTPFRGARSGPMMPARRRPRPKLPGEPAASEMQEPTPPSPVRAESADMAGTPDTTARPTASRRRRNRCTTASSRKWRAC